LHIAIYYSDGQILTAGHQPWLRSYFELCQDYSVRNGWTCEDYVVTVASI